MTEQDEQHARQYKQVAIEKLQGEPIASYALADIDERLDAYVREVALSPEKHNLYEVLSVIKFLRLLRTYSFRAERVKRYIRYYESLKFSGIKGRRCYRLTGIQVFQFASILGFYKETDEGVTRLVRRAILFVPRKFSKTTSTSSLAAFELLFGDSNAQAYTAANGYKQAQICFKEIKKIVLQLDPKRNYFKATREHIEWKSSNPYGKESFVECLSGGADTKDGLNASLIIFDEYAASKYVRDHSDGAELLQVLESSTGNRQSPLTVIITTAGRVLDGPFMQELSTAQRELRGEFTDDSLFSSLFMPDAWEMDHLGSPSVWHKCNPHIGVTVKESFYADSWEAAKRSEEKMLEFKTKLCNVFSSAGSKVWFTQMEAESLSVDFNIERVEGRPPCMVAIDLSVSDDISAVSYNLYSADLRTFHVHTDYYIPQSVLYSHPNAELYTQWIAGGYLNVCKGSIIDGQQIVSDILQRNASLLILQVGYDSYKAQEIINSLSAAVSAAGGNAKEILRAVPQTFGAFTSPVETFEMCARRNPPNVSISRNPVTYWMFGNAYLEEDRMGNKKPMKRKENCKIDGVITTLMTFWLFNNYER